MNFQIKVAQTDIAIEANSGETVLQALQRAGYEIPYSCLKGTCGSCKGEIVSGSCESGQSGDGISTEEVKAGQALFCVAVPTSDLVIKPARIRNKEIQEIKRYSLKISKLIKPAKDVTIVQLRMPIGQRAKFKAGQYLEIILDDGSRRNYSMANIPSSDVIELHIREVANGKFTSQILPALKVGDSLNIEFPKGEFYIRDSAEEPKSRILLASGTGFAPIQSVIQMLGKNENLDGISFYWGGRTKQDLYALEKVHSLLEKYPQFKFIPVLSDALPNEEWHGRVGLVHQAVMDDYSNLSDCEVYACGSPLMVNAARADFVKNRDLDIANFYSDSFA